jgi:superfamily II DNA/RNA helicase
VIDKSREVLETDEHEAESSDSEAERKSVLSELLDRMSAWNGVGISSSILRALSEQGFVEPTEIQVRFTNQSKIVAVKHD